MHVPLQKIAILSPLISFTRLYSVASVVLNQAKMLQKMGHEVTIFVNENCAELEEVLDGVEIMKKVPWCQYKIETTETEFDSSSETLLNFLRNSLGQFDMCITHDLTFQYEFLPFNFAIRKYSSQNQNLKWLHWLHSSPQSHLENHSLLPSFLLSRIVRVMEYALLNSFIVYLNESDRDVVAAFYHVEIDKVKCVYNSIDIYQFKGFNELSIPLCIKARLDEKDVIMVYPARLTYAKQFHKLLMLTAFLKTKNINVSLILCPSYTGNPDASILLPYLHMLKNSYNLDDSELLITSDLGFSNGVSSSVIKDLFGLSNFFVFPSISEAAPLSLLEAGLMGNVLILNDNVAAMHEFGENAYFVNFDDTPISWLEKCHSIMERELSDNKILRQKQLIHRKFNMNLIYANQLLPIIHELIDTTVHGTDCILEANMNSGHRTERLLTDSTAN